MTTKKENGGFTLESMRDLDDLVHRRMDLDGNRLPDPVFLNCEDFALLENAGHCCRACHDAYEGRLPNLSKVCADQYTAMLCCLRGTWLNRQPDKKGLMEMVAFLRDGGDGVNRPAVVE